MSGYGIFRVEKLKTMGNLAGSLKHAFREQYTPNADPYRDNFLITQDTPNTESVMAKYEKLKPEKVRNDQVRAIEILVTASPEAMEEMTPDERIEFLKRSLEFANNEFGEANLLHAQIHNDETTPHLTAFYIPRIVKETKKGSKITLNAKELLGGRKEYSDRQTRFYELVSRDFGLLRGEVGSKANHKKISDYYREVNKFGGDLEQAVRIIEDLEDKLEELEGDKSHFFNKLVSGLIYGIMYSLPLDHPKRDEISEYLGELEQKVVQDVATYEDFTKAIQYLESDVTTYVQDLERKLDQLNKKLSPPKPVMTPKFGM